jgi:hypothetical protein
MNGIPWSDEVRRQRMARRPTLAERFADKVIPEPNTGCFLWEGKADQHGYGLILDGTKNKKAHRVAFELFRRPLQEGEIVGHRCDAPWCVNPDHLWAGTQLENIADMLRKGRHGRDLIRQNCARGSRQGLAKLDEDAIHHIRTSERGSSDLAREYGVTKANINMIRRRATWKHVP